jgi:signal transduction histidine kinase
VTAHRARLAVGTRLALTFAAVFVLAGATIIAITLTLARKSLDKAAANQAAVSALNSAVQSIVPSTPDLPSSSGRTVPIESGSYSGTDSSSPSSTPVPSGSPSSSGPTAPLTSPPKSPSGSDSRQGELLRANSDYARATRNDAERRILAGSAVAIAGLVPVAGLLGWLLARRALRPVRAVTGAAQRVSGHQLSERLAIAGPRDEITELATTFDAMLDRLEHAFDARRRFVANASHELRTPLAVAGTAVDVVLAKPQRTPEQLEAMARDVRAAVDQAEQVVESLLALTRSQHLDHRREPVDLATLAEDALDARAAAIAERGLTVSTQLADAPALGDRALLERLVGNLVENAIRHNVDGGQLEVRTGLAYGHPTLEAANSGAVIAPDRVGALVEPFQRLDGRARSAESGLGLGLAIVKAVADVHGAALTLTALPFGGLHVQLRLPPR